MPQMQHGGPGRAGGGAELGGLRALHHYLQRTAVQGTRSSWPAWPDASVLGCCQCRPALLGGTVPRQVLVLEHVRGPNPDPVRRKQFQRQLRIQPGKSPPLMNKADLGEQHVIPGRSPANSRTKSS